MCCGCYWKCCVGFGAAIQVVVGTSLFGSILFYSFSATAESTAATVFGMQKTAAYSLYPNYGGVEAFKRVVLATYFLLCAILGAVTLFCEESYTRMKNITIITIILLVVWIIGYPTIYIKTNVYDHLGMYYGTQFFILIVFATFGITQMVNLLGYISWLKIERQDALRLYAEVTQIKYV